MKNVLVTGANGHLGFNLVRLLKQRGYAVHASVRDTRSSRKTMHLKQLDVAIVELDIMQPHTLPRAMADMDCVFHVAAVYDITSKNPAKEVQEPSIVGTANVLEAARQAGVRKVIMTSSTTAVGNHAPGGRPLDESCWNDAAIEPYAQGKTEAERRAWRFAKAHKLDLVTILPSAMLGPGFYRHTPTTQSFEQLLRGAIPFALPLSFSFIDVRDSALAHVLAYENAQASGRYIVSTHYCSLMDLFEAVKRAAPEVKIPSRTMPQKMLRVVPLLDWLGNKVAKLPRFATTDFIREYAGKQALFSSAKARAELGWTPQYDFATSVADTVDWVKQTFMRERKAG